MNIHQVVKATERADAMASEDTIHLFLERNGVNPFHFIQETLPYWQDALEKAGPDRAAELCGAEFLRGLVVGVLAARIEAEEAG